MAAPGSQGAHGVSPNEEVQSILINKNIWVGHLYSNSSPRHRVPKKTTREVHTHARAREIASLATTLQRLVRELPMAASVCEIPEVQSISIIKNISSTPPPEGVLKMRGKYTGARCLGRGGGQRCAEKVAGARCLFRGVRCLRVQNKRKKREGQDVDAEG